jgi:hypothetical protein
VVERGEERKTRHSFLILTAENWEALNQVRIFASQISHTKTIPSETNAAPPACTRQQLAGRTPADAWQCGVFQYRVRRKPKSHLPHVSVLPAKHITNQQTKF